MSSQSRNQLKQFQSVASSLLIIKGPFLKGSIRSAKHLCGKPNCKCSRGQLHTTTFLTIYRNGKQKTICFNKDRQRLLQKPLLDNQKYLTALKSLEKSFGNLISSLKYYHRKNILNLDKIIKP